MAPRPPPLPGLIQSPHSRLPLGGAPGPAGAPSGGVARSLRRRLRCWRRCWRRLRLAPCGPCHGPYSATVSLPASHWQAGEGACATRTPTPPRTPPKAPGIRRSDARQERTPFGPGPGRCWSLLQHLEEAPWRLSARFIARCRRGAPPPWPAAAVNAHCRSGFFETADPPLPRCAKVQSLHIGCAMCNVQCAMCNAQCAI